MQNAQLTIRMTSEQVKALKDAHARTFAEHRLSFNAWAVALLTGEEMPTSPRPK